MTPQLTIDQLPKPLNLPLLEGQLEIINAHLSPMTPEEILRWAVEYLPGLYQTTAFGLTGLAAIDMLSKISQSPPPLIFLDTLYHFPETYELVDEVQRHYRCLISVYKPAGCESVSDFETKYGQNFWRSNESTYDFLVKVNIQRNMIDVTTDVFD